jgi:tetratricopeptide (TPR) repeat protein
MSPQSTQAALASLNGARPVLAHFDQPRSAEDLAADIIDLWSGVESALQTLVGNSSLSGQQLIRAARQAELITLDQAHSLLEFLAARDRANRTSYKPTQADGDAAVDGFRALEGALSGGGSASASARSASTSPSPAAYTPRSRPAVTPPPAPPPSQPASPYAPPTAGGGYRQPPAYAGRKMAGPPTIELPGAFMSEGRSVSADKTPPGTGGVGRGQVEHALAVAQSRRRFPDLSWPVWAAIAAVVILLIGGYLLFGRGGGSGDNVSAGISAMKNGQLETARGEFAKAVKDDPGAATPHVFLARLARDQGDLATARAELDTALRLEPSNANALREMGLVLFASRQYDLARRFFVRAVQANPQDRATQGYLGCTMMRLGRVQEGTNWINKAGTNGPWSACLPPATQPTPPPL